ncbi:MAG: T9SS type A sorting domain-containing protein [Saprospiraceae bacterium]|nr:T9SS type A sorting domain-containing protein [Saprospiraceae bacterium]
MNNIKFFIVTLCFLSALKIDAQTVIFEDNFETGTLKAEWKAAPNLTGANGVVEVSTDAERNGQYGVRMGKSTAGNGAFTTNALDLRLNLAGRTQLEMTFNIKDISDETHVQDGLYLSNNGGSSFVKVFDFKPDLWCDAYGQFPPFDIYQLATKNGLTFNNQFIIRIQQYDNDDFCCGDADGFYIDDVKIYIPNLAYATLPFSDDFESGILGSSWARRFADGTVSPALDVTKPTNVVEVRNGIGFNSQFAVAMGQECANSLFAANALDLHLNLTPSSQVELSFIIKDISDETHMQDGIYFSNNGGISFVKVFDFKPSLWCDEYGQFPPLDVDDLATKAGLTLTPQFVIRFQQYDNDDFCCGDADGFYIDDVKVYVPNLTYVTLPFSDDFETGILGNAWARRFADATALPATDVTKPTNVVEVQNGIGFNSQFAVAMGQECANTLFATNALDLHLNLANASQVELTFMIKDLSDETHFQDGLYFSNDGGITFKKVLSFEPSNWCDEYGQLPPIDVDDLAAKAGLALTNRFVIRFQQHDNDDFCCGDADGFYIDNVRVYTPTTTYAPLPFSDGFETGQFSSSWKWRNTHLFIIEGPSLTKPSSVVAVTNGIGANSQYAVKIGKECEDGFAANALDLLLNLANSTQVELNFKLYDVSNENHPQDAIYFSNNGGATFTQVYTFDFTSIPDFQYTNIKINVSDLAARNGLTLTPQFIIRFHQYDDADFCCGDADGIYIDDVTVTAKPNKIGDISELEGLTISPNPSQDRLNLNYTEGVLKSIEIVNLTGQVLLRRELEAHQTTIDVQTLVNGLYFLNISTLEGKWATIKFVKN